MHIIHSKSPPFSGKRSGHNWCARTIVYKTKAGTSQTRVSTDTSSTAILLLSRERGQVTTGAPGRSCTRRRQVPPRPGCPEAHPSTAIRLLSRERGQVTTGAPGRSCVRRRQVPPRPGCPQAHPSTAIRLLSRERGQVTTGAPGRSCTRRRQVPPRPGCPQTHPPQ